MGAGNGSGNGHSSQVPAPTPSGAGTSAAAPTNGAETKPKKKPGRPYQPGQSGNPTGEGAGRKPGLPARNARLGMLLEKKIRPSVAKLIKSRYKIDVAGLTYEEALLDLAIAYEAKGKEWLLERLLGYSYLTLNAEICQLANPPAAAGQGVSVDFNLNNYERMISETEPRPERPGFDRDN